MQGVLGEEVVHGRELGVAADRDRADGRGGAEEQARVERRPNAGDGADQGEVAVDGERLQ